MIPASREIVLHDLIGKQDTHLNYCHKDVFFFFFFFFFFELLSVS